MNRGDGIAAIAGNGRIRRAGAITVRLRLEVRQGAGRAADVLARLKSGTKIGLWVV